MSRSVCLRLYQRHINLNLKHIDHSINRVSIPLVQYTSGILTLYLSSDPLSFFFFFFYYARLLRCVYQLQMQQIAVIKRPQERRSRN
jgi:hypothetical protein